MTDPVKRRLLSEVASSAGEANRLRKALDAELARRDSRALKAQAEGKASYVDLMEATGLTRIGVSKMLKRQKDRA